ncbi:hypothetical protein CAY53_02920 [Desulfobulbus oralis]|uniref:Transposase IS30-like HTH domain-containing protein n=1 Tax=Desulfobulbus oralis TaxID=1986146 RepID=A0A2L1GLK2_9BACT|nr:hypothetical protein CAY53_02920 [Desulfobulbus oralis]
MSHSHLTLEERIRIEIFVSMGLSCREMARRLGRSHSTVSRELRQGRSKSGCRTRTADCRSRKKRKMLRHDAARAAPIWSLRLMRSSVATGLLGKLQAAFALAARHQREWGGLLRQYCPRGISLHKITEKQIRNVVERLHKRPRKW